MNLVLVPGDVYPHTAVPNNSARIPLSAAQVQSRSGVQLIATCRQAYNEGHALFYSSNTFHLPPTMTFEWSDRLQPKHKFLIKRIGITIGPNELDASMIRSFKKAHKKLDARRDSLSNETNIIYEAVSETLNKTWYSKMSYMAAWSSLEEITLRLFKNSDTPTIPLNHKYTFDYHETTLPYHERTLQHYELVANMKDWGYWNSKSSYWEKILWWPRMLVSANIAAKNDASTWTKLETKCTHRGTTWTEVIEWLYVRKPDELAGHLAADVAEYPARDRVEAPAKVQAEDLAEDFWEYIKNVEYEIYGGYG